MASASVAQDQAGPAGVGALSGPSAGGPTSAPIKAAPLGAPKPSAVSATGAPAVAPLGKPGKPKFALKRVGPGGAGAAAPDRAAEVARLIKAYHGIAIGYYDMLVLADTPEEVAAAKIHEPSVKALRPIVRLLAEIVAVDPSDEPALDALLFIRRYVGVPLIDETLAEGLPSEGPEESGIDALIVAHHADNPKVADAILTLQPSPATDKFVFELYKKSRLPRVRAMAGMTLIKSLQNGDQAEFAEKLAEAMANDHYLGGVPFSSRPDGPSARDWAEGKLREIRLVSVGKVLPDVAGERLGGGVEHVSDYRGKVVVLDVWTTWCGPCVAMIPHQVEMVERLRDEPFALLSVSCDEDRQTVEGFLKESEMPWNHWWVSPESEFKKTLNIASFPTVIVLDAEGVIRHKNIKGKELDDAVEQLLREAKQSRDPS